MRHDTIFALSSGQPPAAIAVIRISGPAAASAVVKLAGRCPPVRRARLARLRDQNDETLDHALVLWMPGPQTETGEDQAELHLHGGRAVVMAVERELGGLPGLRRAEPGEFTRRAFANGRINLAEVEGLADLVAAETERQRRNAIALAGGAFSRRIEDWRERILRAGAMVEAVLDFSDEEDVVSDDAWKALIAAIAVEITDALSVPPAERLKDGIRVVIAGPPNAGKSTLLNALAGREAAITSEIAGTTRDIVEVPVSIGGVAFVISDTAGLRDADDPIERVGVTRAADAVAQADIVLWLGSPQDAPPGAVCLFARADIRAVPTDPALISISAVTGAGMGALRDMLIARSAKLLPGESDVALNRRQRVALADAGEGLQLAISTEDLLIAAEGLRQARNAVDRITGRAGVEDMLDGLFGRFCIGK